MFTSGTTGPAKGVVMPHQQVASAAWDAVHDLEITSRSIIYTFNPLFHLNALVFGPFAALLAGASTVIRSQFPRERLRTDLHATRATHWCPPPFVVRGLLASPPGPEDRLLALRMVATIGLLAAEIEAFEQRFGCRITGGYGSTEAGMMCRMQTERAHVAGPPSDRCELRIVDAQGQDLPRGEVGEIWARARLPHDRMLGYYRNPEATAAAFAGEWFRTGDLGRFDADGYLVFVDRLKDSLKRRGSNISTFEVEQALATFPGVVDAAVVGTRADPTAEEEVRAFIEVADPDRRAPWDYAGLIQHCARHLAWYMVPRYVDVVGALPRTPLGKVRKSELKSLPLAPATFDVKAAGIVVER
jgi:crotonobetaine/carnitine-CoA ligase